MLNVTNIGLPEDPNFPPFNIFTPNPILPIIPKELRGLSAIILNKDPNLSIINPSSLLSAIFAINFDIFSAKGAIFTINVSLAFSNIRADASASFPAAIEVSNFPSAIAFKAAS